MNPRTQRGFLILADITGYTPFVAETELEHSQEILRRMLNSIISTLTPVFTLAEVEGDAVFVYSKDPQNNTNSTTDSNSRGRLADIVPDMIESLYYSFRDKRKSVNRAMTCECKACKMATTLDLKFIVHYGEYILNNVGGKTKPLGSCVNVAHRLLKNHVTETTGWKAYALFTKECLDHIKLNSTQLHSETETFDHIGTVETFSMDLDSMYRKFVDERVVYVTADEADFIVQRDFPVAPSLLWEWFNDPKMKTRWNDGSNWDILARPTGRLGRGATNHCVNSKVIERILDYRPFDYYTSSLGRGPVDFTLTCKFQSVGEGCRLTWYIKMNGFLPAGIKKPLTKLLFEKGMGVHKNLDRLLNIIEAEQLMEEV
ncbi:DUF2652 domain-containing protein [Chryseolinea sp. T2]|uniref:DUF2652 domain-containing protein n=1 Tax=Chryseolinea sp. T2 TaxID=3129255 RepID=UPI0030788E81